MKKGQSEELFNKKEMGMRVEYTEKTGTEYDHVKGIGEGRMVKMVYRKSAEGNRGRGRPQRR